MSQKKVYKILSVDDWEKSKKIGFIKKSYRNMIIKGIDKKFFKNNKINLKNLYFTMGDTLEIY